MNTATLLNVNLPDTLAERAEEAGLLTSGVFARVMREALRRQAAGEVFEPMTEDEMASFPIRTREEIQAKVDEVQAEERRERLMRSRT